MQKLKAFFSNLNYAVLGFIAFSTRLVIFGASFADAAVLLGFAGLYGFSIYMKQHEVSKYNEKFKEDVKIEFKKAAEEIVKLNTKVSAVTLGGNLRKPFGGQG